MLKSQTITILTNALAVDQRSMIGYGELVLDSARQTEIQVIEWRCASMFARLPLRGRLRKLALNLDRFIVTPLMLIGRKADLVHVVDPGNCIYLPLIRHRRSIVTVHDLIPYLARDEKLPGFTPTRTGRWLMDRILSQLAKVDHIVCVSESTRRDLFSYIDISPERVSVILNAVFQPMAPALPTDCHAFRSRHGIPENAPLVLHVGRNFYKNRPMVLKVFAQVRQQIPEVRLVLVGALEGSLKDQISQLGVEDAIHVLEFVPREDMATLYSTASVLLFPSLYEGFGYPVVEAQMCGTPVVCSDRGSLPEVAGDSTVVVPASDLLKITSAVCGFINSAAGLQTTADTNEDITNRFSQHKWSSAYQDLYKNLL